MTSRTAFAFACALALGGCASYAPGVRGDGPYAGRYDDGYYSASANGYGDYYYDRPEIVYRDIYPGYGAYGAYGFGYGRFGYDPWFRDPWYGWGGYPYGGWGYHPWPGHHRHPPPGGYTASGIHPIQVPIRVARHAVGAPARSDDGPRGGMRERVSDRPSPGPRDDPRDPPHRERPQR